MQVSYQNLIEGSDLSQPIPGGRPGRNPSRIRNRRIGTSDRAHNAANPCQGGRMEIPDQPEGYRHWAARSGPKSIFALVLCQLNSNVLAVVVTKS
jgi:hypothetical protein